MNMHIAQLIVLGLLGLCILTMIVPITSVHASVLNQGQHLDVSTTAPTCSMTVANTGDIVVMLMQFTQNGESSLSPADTLGTINWHIQKFASTGEFIVWSQTSAAGADIITVTLSPNTINAASFCYDLDNMPNFVVSWGSSSDTSTSLAISPAINMNAGSTVLAIAYMAHTTAGYVAGASFTQSAGGTIHIDNSGAGEEAASEYANGLGASTSTTCPATQTFSAFWADACIIFAQSISSPSGPTTTTTTTTTIQNLVDTQMFDTGSQLAVVCFIGLLIGVVYKAYKK